MDVNPGKFAKKKDLAETNMAVASLTAAVMGKVDTATFLAYQATVTSALATKADADVTPTFDDVYTRTSIDGMIADTLNRNNNLGDLTDVGQAVIALGLSNDDGVTFFSAAVGTNNYDPADPDTFVNLADHLRVYNAAGSAFRVDSAGDVFAKGRLRPIWSSTLTDTSSVEFLRVPTYDAFGDLTFFMSRTPISGNNGAGDRGNYVWGTGFNCTALGHAANTSVVSSSQRVERSYGTGAGTPSVYAIEYHLACLTPNATDDATGTERRWYSVYGSSLGNACEHHPIGTVWDFLSPYPTGRRVVTMLAGGATGESGNSFDGVTVTAADTPLVALRGKTQLKFEAQNQTIVLGSSNVSLLGVDNSMGLLVGDSGKANTLRGSWTMAADSGYGGFKAYGNSGSGQVAWSLQTVNDSVGSNKYLLEACNQTTSYFRVGVPNSTGTGVEMAFGLNAHVYPNYSRNETGTLTLHGSVAFGTGITGATTISNNGIGTTSTDGLLLTNTTTGSAQYSPRLRLHGNGRDTSSGTVDYPFDFRVELRPGTANYVGGSSSVLFFGISQNGGAYTDFLQVSSVGNVASGNNWSVNSLTSTQGFTGLNGAVTQSRNGIGTTSADGLVLQNTTVGSVQYAPQIRLTGNGRNTSAGGSNVTAQAIIKVNPASDTNNNDAAGSFAITFGVAGSETNVLSYSRGSNVVTVPSLSVSSTTGLSVTNGTTTGSLRVSGSSTPATASAAGTAGQIQWDADYIYVCTATNTWKRAALSTW